jgi:hypothetical protein
MAVAVYQEQFEPNVMSQINQSINWPARLRGFCTNHTYDEDTRTIVFYEPSYALESALMFFGSVYNYLRYCVWIAHPNSGIIFTAHGDSSLGKLTKNDVCFPILSWNDVLQHMSFVQSTTVNTPYTTTIGQCERYLDYLEYIEVVYPIGADIICILSPEIYKKSTPILYFRLRPSPTEMKLLERTAVFRTLSEDPDDVYFAWLQLAVTNNKKLSEIL